MQKLRTALLRFEKTIEHRIWESSFTGEELEERLDYRFGNKSITIFFEYGFEKYNKITIKDGTMKYIYAQLNSALDEILSTEIEYEEEDYSHLMEQFRPVLA